MDFKFVSAVGSFGTPYAEEVALELRAVSCQLIRLIESWFLKCSEYGSPITLYIVLHFYVFSPFNSTGSGRANVHLSQTKVALAKPGRFLVCRV